MEPIELLQQELNKWKIALIKSENAFNEGNIDYTTYQRHKENLTLKIEKYTHAIRTLQIYG